MNITKKNGRVVLYDTEKIVKSILKAGADTPGEEVSRHLASYIADEVFAKLTESTRMRLCKTLSDGAAGNRKKVYRIRKITHSVITTASATLCCRGSLFIHIAKH